ncbi:MAG TPA: glycine--tRNA ligase subunit beta [Rickettsiales bacterium]|nr:glycine--tRNA ligase subunit beta [Rickettsiales bacterium]
MSDFLLELFSEEIPARMQSEAARHLAATFTDALKQAGIEHGKVKTFVTPRRLAVLAEGIPTIQPDITVEKKGPKTSAPQAALDGFLRKENLAVEQLEKRTVGKDEIYFAVVHQKGQPTATLLKSIIEKILAAFPWPKSMRWGSNPTRWVRPLHSILCILGNEIVPVEFAGFKAGNTTCSHRFLAPQTITINSPADYESALAKACVMADQEKRKAEIQKQAEALAASHKLKLKRDDGLLAEVTGLVEFPNLLLGNIDAQFMDLPPEVLTSEMRTHQKYFALLDSSGKLADKFLITSNMTTQDGGKAIVAGNERVLRARLADGRFFFDQDRKKILAQWAEGLKDVTFHAKIGTIADKVDRIRKLAVELIRFVPGADKAAVELAANLCKADLVTGMVGEFPELQGVMGRYYALHEKLPVIIADAIREHYLPLGPDSPVPHSPVSICIALADKLDTLISMFAAGEKPTGSKDPFALRRSALGIIRIILENNLRLPLKSLLNEELLAFFSDRLIVQLKEQGIRADIIKSVMAGGDDDLVRVVARAKAIQDFLAAEDGANLLAAYKRAANILNIEEKKDNIRYNGSIKTALLQQDEEKKLSESLASTTPETLKWLEKEEFSQAMTVLSSLRSPVDRFFDAVMVNAEDKDLRANRLSLLSQIRITLDGIADFSLIEG